jgi:low temperature requirement protein LtrA
MDGNQSYREKGERVPSRFELFFDLVFVAIAHQLSEAAAEHAGGPGLLLFVLVSIWSVWSTPWLNTLQTFL